MATTTPKKRITFKVNAEPGATVYLAGSFNEWTPMAKPLKDNGKGTFSTTVMLPVGEHEYKFIINGEWTADPQRTDWKTNSFGTLNSFITVTS